MPGCRSGALCERQPESHRGRGDDHTRRITNASQYYQLIIKYRSIYKRRVSKKKMRKEEMLNQKCSDVDSSPSAAASGIGVDLHHLYDQSLSPVSDDIRSHLGQRELNGTECREPHHLHVP
jgi:hypothetical protein